MTEEQSLLQEVIDAYEHQHWAIISKSGAGTNNTTRFIQMDGQAYVLRRYETHRDTAKVRYEHAVLLALQQQGLPIHTPVPIMNKQGNSYTVLAASDHQLAAIFTFTEGNNPKLETLDEVYAYGRAVGILSTALRRIALPLSPVYPPYYEIETAYPQCSAERLAAFCLQPPAPFTACASQLAFIWAQYRTFLERLPQLSGLPKQLVHGDLNRTNVLADTAGDIHAILDFEFVTLDLRCMELAVALTDICNPADPSPAMSQRVAQFMRGYTSQASLTAEEAAAIPHLFTLRKLDVFLHFLSRYFDGVNDEKLVLRCIGELVEQLTAAEEGLQIVQQVIAAFSDSIAAADAWR